MSWPLAGKVDQSGRQWAGPIPCVKRRRAFRAAAIVFACLAAPAARIAAADTSAPNVTEDTFLGDNVPVVLSATRLAQPLDETPASVTVITHDMIRASGAQDIPDVLRLVPGFQVGHVNGYTYAVTYHGLSDEYARRMQVLVDGRSVYTPAFGGTDWSALPLAIEDIDHIEVIRGPNGVTYGSNSFAAVINIITRLPSQDQGAEASYTGGDIDLKRTQARYGGSAGNLTYRLTGEYRQDSGFKTVRPDASQWSLLTFRGDYTPTQIDDVDIQFGYKSGLRGQGIYDDESGLNPQRNEDVTEQFEQLRWRHALDRQSETDLQFYHIYHRGLDSYETPLISTILSTSPGNVQAALGVPDQTLRLNNDLYTERYDLEFQHLFALEPGWRFVWGAETRLDRVKGPDYFNTANFLDNHLYQVFGNAEWRFAPAWILNAGAMYEHNDLTGGDVSPRIGLNYHVTPSQTLRASVSRAYRAPSMFESNADYAVHAGDGTLIYPHFLSTERLKPERITSYELGYLGEFPSIDSTLDLKIFHEEIRDVIAVAYDSSLPNPLGPYYAALPPQTFVNNGYANINGAELQARVRIVPTTQLVFSEAYADQHGEFLNDVVAGTYVDSHLTTPSWTTSALLQHRFPAGIEASAGYYHVTNMRFIGGGSDDYTGCYSTLDMRLAYQLRLGRFQGELALVGQNLLDTYFDFKSANVPGKRYFLTLRIGTR
jgi:iron complex outermembrane receptor protein